MPRAQHEFLPTHHEHTVDLSIVIPAFNEEERLPASLESVQSWLERDGRSFELIVVDDGSSDHTSLVAQQFATCRCENARVIRLPRNRGKGAAVREGVLASVGRQVLITDADLSTPIAELSKLEAEAPGNDFRIGSRSIPSAQVTRSQPWFRVLIGRIFNVLVQALAVRGISDTQCGFKLLPGGIARDLLSRSVVDGFAYDVELLWLARRSDIPIVEVGVEWLDDRRSKVQPWRDGPGMLGEILKFRAHHLTAGSHKATRSFAAISALLLALTSLLSSSCAPHVPQPESDSGLVCESNIEWILAFELEEDVAGGEHEQFINADGQLLFEVFKPSEHDDFDRAVGWSQVKQEAQRVILCHLEGRPLLRLQAELEWGIPVIAAKWRGEHGVQEIKVRDDGTILFLELPKEEPIPRPVMQAAAKREIEALLLYPSELVLDKINKGRIPNQATAPI